MKRENGSIMLGSLDAKLNVIFLIADLRTSIEDHVLANIDILILL